MHYCCVKYCQNKATNGVYFNSRKLIAGSLLNSKIFQENEELLGSGHKNTNVSIDSLMIAEFARASSSQVND